MFLFLSHGSSDASQARQVRDLLLGETPHAKIALSSEYGSGPIGGASWRSWINRSLRTCDAVVFLASANSLTPWCSAELAQAQTLNLPIIPLRTDDEVNPADVNPLISELHIAPLDQPPAQLWELIKRHVKPGAVPTPPLDETVCPYPGLNPVAEHQESLFYGRSDEIGRLEDDLDREAPTCLVVSGPSGSGKSSLLRAGLLPRLRRDGWAIVGPHQPHQLAEQLRAGTTQPENVSETGNRRRLVVIDQAEEVLQLPDDELQAIREYLDPLPAGQTSVLLAVRSEFRTAVDKIVTRPIDHYVTYLDRDGLRALIRGPAKKVQLDVDDELVQELVDQTQTGAALPLLAYTLRQLWHRRDPVNVRLKSSVLTDMGGVRGILNQQANAALRKASAAEESHAPVLQLLSRLATPDQNPPTRTPLTIANLNEQQRSWIDAFVNVGLLTYRTTYKVDDHLEAGAKPSGTDIVDVAHEALFEWPPLQAAIKTNRDQNRNLNAIEFAAQLWHRDGQQDQSLLLAGSRLDLARTQGLDQASPVLASFVKRSVEREHSRRRTKRLNILLAVTTVMAIAATVIAFQLKESADDQRDEATEQRNLAEAANTRSSAIRTAAQASSAVSTRRDFAFLAAAAAYRIDANPTTEATLLSVLAAPEGPINYFHDDDIDWTSVVMVAPSLLAVVDVDGQLLEIDLTTQQRTAVEAEGLGDVSIQTIDLVENSTLVAFTGSDSTGPLVGLVDLDTKQVVVQNHDQPVEGVAAYQSPDANVSDGTATGPVRVVWGDVEGVVSTSTIELSKPGQLRQPSTVDTHPEAIDDLAISPDGQWLAATSGRHVRLHKQQDQGWGAGEVLHDAGPAIWQAEVVEFRQDGPSELYAVGSDPTIRKWSLGSGTAKAEPDVGTHIGGVLAVAVDPHSPLLYTTGLEGHLQRWDIEAGAQVGSQLDAHRTTAFAVSTAGNNSVVSGSENMAVVWDLAPERVIDRTGLLPESWVDETFAGLVYGEGPLAAITLDGRVLVADNPALLAPENASRGWWVGQRLVVDATERDDPDTADRELWQVGPGEPILRAEGHTAIDVGQCLAALATAAVISFEPIGSCEAPPPIPLSDDVEKTATGDPPILLRFSPDQTKLMAVYRANRIEVRQVTNGEVVAAFRSTQPTISTAAEWIDDDVFLVGHDRGGDTELFDLSAEDPAVPLAVLDLHDDAIRSVAIGGDSRRLATSGEDGRIVQTSLTENRIDVAAEPLIGRRRETENQFDATVKGLRYVDGGSALLSLHGHQLKAWELDPEALVSLACEQAGRQLSGSELVTLDLSASDQPCPSPS